MHLNYAMMGINALAFGITADISMLAVAIFNGACGWWCFKISEKIT